VGRAPLRLLEDEAHGRPPGKPLANWGLHLIDVNLAMGNLLDLVDAQSKAYRSRR
jgi:hypothetical protein